MKTLFVLIDGLGDVGYTPLQAAHKPNLNFLAQNGLNGLMDPVEVGLACGSDTAHLSLLGYNPFTCYRGRGAFESMGAGLDMKVGDIAFKSNFAFIHEGIVKSRRADRNFEKEGTILCSFLDGMKIPGFEDVKVSFKYATEHRCGIRLSGPNLSDCISGTDPLKDNLSLLECAPLNSEAVHTCKVVHALDKEIQRLLINHPINIERMQNGKNPANVILMRGCGSRIQVPSFQEMHQMRGFMIAPTCIIAGLGMSLGLDIIKVEGATGDYHTDLLAKGREALKQIKEYDFGFIHIKAVDDAGHDKDYAKKVHFIEKSDELIGLLLGSFDGVIVVTGDHSTPWQYGDHSCEPVPFVISEIGKCLQDKVECFDEVHAALGGLGRFPGSQVMKIIKSVINGL